MNHDIAHSACPDSSAGWTESLVDRTGTIIAGLASREGSDEFVVQRAVRGLTDLPGVADARLVAAPFHAHETASRTAVDGLVWTSVPVGQDRRLRLACAGAARPALVQAVRLVVRAIEGRLEGGKDQRSRIDAVRYAIDKSNLRETQDLLRIESARLRTLINSIHVSILLVDEQLRITEVNNAALGMMKLTGPAPSVIGMRLTDLVTRVSGEARQVVETAIDFAQRSIGGRRPVHREEVPLPGNIMVEASYLPIDLDGRVRGHLLMGQDVTGRARAQEVVEARNRELAALSTLRNAFLATVSHELRTPLTAASSLVEGLAMGGQDEETRAQVVEALRRNTDRLTVLVEYLLVLARLESNQVALAKQIVDTRQLVTERVAAVRREAGAHVTLIESVDDGPAEVTGDPDWLVRMVHYVLSGAVAASAAGTTVAVDSGVDADGWRLTVTGAELADRHSGHLFAAIVAGRDQVQRQSPGSDRIGVGLGFMLADAIAKRHGGDLTIESGTGNSTIRVCVPAR